MLTTACTGTITGQRSEGTFGGADASSELVDAAADASVQQTPDAQPSPVCGDDVCDEGETCVSCQVDCGACSAVCGDGTCEGNGGETCTGCDSDCNTVEQVCGNGSCDGGETPESCNPDCGPLLWPPDWDAFEQEVLVLINAERDAGTDCPNGVEKDPLPPLTMDDNLQRAARLHSWDMSFSNYFEHTSCNGRTPWQRAAAAGTSASGETIGGGYPTPAAMVSGWMNSSGHCAILMSTRTQVGVGYATVGGGKWTALFR